MKKNNQNKNRRSAGFTLTEMLIAMLLMLMSAAMLARGVAISQKAQRDVSDAANAQLLLSTTITLLRHELGTANLPTVTDEGKGLQYSTSANGSFSEISQDAEGIWLTQFANLEGQSVKQLLVTSETATPGMAAGFEQVAIDTNACTITFTNLRVTKDGAELALQDNLIIGYSY